MFDRFTDRAKKVVNLARQEAQKYNHRELLVEHLLLGLVQETTGAASNVLMNLGINIVDLRRKIESVMVSSPASIPNGQMPFSMLAKKALEAAADEAKGLGHGYIGTEHILLGILHTDTVSAKILKDQGIGIENTRGEILEFLGQEESDNGPGMPVAPGSNSKTPAIDAFCRDLTQLAKEAKLDPVIGRENEVERVIQILSRRTKNNPVIIGDAGVGKTAIIEGIAQRIVANDVPENMASKRVVTLDLALMLAGTKYRGQFEERLKTLVMEVRKAGNILLFIDEIHTLVGAGANEGGMDAANILKPALSRGELQCIGATTLGEYRKSIEKDGALERRFQSVIVEPPSTENTVKILNGLKERYENHHNVNYSKEAIDEAVHLADRYITARNFPDKAIDVIDEAGARTRIKSSYLPPEVRAAQAEAKKLQLEKEEAVKNQEFEKAAAIRDQLAKVNEALAGQAVDTSRHMVTPKEIQETVSKMTGVPLARLEKTEMEQLLGMEGVLNLKVINQGEAVSAISRSIRRSRSGLKDPKRPIGSFLFLGQSGVGKTYLTKQLAKFMFGTEEAVIPIDMSEYMEKHNASRLIGAPPGYVGYEEGGQLTEKVRRRPYSVILLDEVEKAHPDVFNLLLQVFEEGRLTDSLGRVVDFRNTIIVMTSNIGSNLMLGSPGLGFNAKDNASQEEKKKRIKNTVLGEVQAYFRPEFLNRIDELIVFNPLQESDLIQILELQLKDVLARASDKGLTVTLTDSTKKFLITEGHTVEYGARPMRRAIEKFIEDPLAEYLLKNQDTVGTIHFDIVDKVPTIIPTVDTVKRKPKKVPQ